MKRLLILLVLLPSFVVTTEAEDLGTLLMNATFKISGKTSEGQTIGTCFIIGRPVPEDPNRGSYVLVTANHVLADIQSDTATLWLRTKVKDDYVKTPWVVPIRREKKPLWSKHPDADVAAMLVRLPKKAEVNLLPMRFLVTDDKLKELEVHPGDRLFTLGFPLGLEANSAGFPIMRSGIIAGYPILPTKKTKGMLFDFEVFKGNSGGPVFMIEQNRFYRGKIHFGISSFIAGLVIAEKRKPVAVQTPSEIKKDYQPIMVAVVIHSSLIKETIDMLPKPKNPQPKVE